MTLEVENEAHPRAAVMLADAGWSPHPTWGVFTRGTLVMGGDLLGGFHVKDWGMDIHGPDTPDTAEEAAAWLVQRFAIPADVVTFASVPEPEPEHDDPSAPDSGGADAGGGDASVSGESDDPELASDDGGAGSAPMGDAEPIDADFTVHDLDTIELIEPDEPDFGRELLEFEEELTGEPAPSADAAGAFIFGDNLHQKRTAMAGVVGIIAEDRVSEIEARAAEQPGEFNAVQTIVTTNLDKFTGAFSLQDANSRATYDRWLVLDTARKAIVLVNERRRDMIKAVLKMSHAEIEAFDPSEGWP